MKSMEVSMFKKIIAVTALATMASFSLVAAEHWGWKQSTDSWYGGYQKKEITQIFPETDRKVASEQKKVVYSDNEIWRHHYQWKAKEK